MQFDHTLVNRVFDRTTLGRASRRGIERVDAVDRATDELTTYGDSSL